MTSTVTGDVGSAPSEPFVVVTRTEPVSSSGFGGGLPGREAGRTPGDTGNATPPAPSHPGAAHSDGEFSFSDDIEFFEEPTVLTKECSTQTVAFCVNTFSSKTCLEMLANCCCLSRR